MEREEREAQKSENVVSFAQTSRKKMLVGAISVIVALLFLVASFFIGFAVARRETDEQERSLLWMIDRVEENYHDEVSRDELFDRMYDALALDKFCTHYTPEEYEELINSSNGLNEGYGVTFTSVSGAVRIYRVTGNSPADLAGLKKGMYLYEADGAEPVSGSAANEYLGERESVTLTCGYEADASDAQPYTLHRAAYHAAYCYYADSENTYRFRGETPTLTVAGEGLSGLPADTAYIALIQFEGHAAEEFEACLSLMKERSRKHLILDLRGNGGGYLSILCGISAHLLRNAEGKNPLVTQARFRSGATENYCASGNDFSNFFESDARIRVLADENSASASEALIGALISYGTCGYGDIYLRKGGKAIAKTYGKGVMQSRFTAPDNNALRLTVADIYWPNGRCIHGVGITEEDGAVPVSAPLLPNGTDEFLEKFLATLT